VLLVVLVLMGQREGLDLGLESMGLLIDLGIGIKDNCNEWAGVRKLMSSLACVCMRAPRFFSQARMRKLWP
jgi:hypothetical protein